LSQLRRGKRFVGGSRAKGSPLGGPEKSVSRNPYTMAVLWWLLSLQVVLILPPSYHLATPSSGSGQLRRLWLQDHCSAGICTNVVIGRSDYVILSQAPIGGTTMLTFLNSSIAKIPHLLFDTFPDLQVLRMENCSLETFEKPQFEGASNLMSLFLGYNRLKDIPKNIFLGADNLATLHLQGNQLKQLGNHSFHALKEVKELSLAENQLEQISLGVFSGMRKLMDLNLAGNRLDALPSQNHLCLHHSKLWPKGGEKSTEN